MGGVDAEALLRAFVRCRRRSRARPGLGSLDETPMAASLLGGGHGHVAKGAASDLENDHAGEEDDEGLPLKERFAEALVVCENAAGAETEKARVDLERAMRAVENLIQRKFLRG